MSTKQSAFEKLNIKRVPIHISTEVAKFIDSLYDDDDEDASNIPDALIFKNPYTKEQIELALRRLMGFYVTRSFIDSFTIDELVSTPDLLAVGITIKLKEHEFDISISTKF